MALRITDVGTVHVVRPSVVYNPFMIAATSAQSRQQVPAALLEDMARRRFIVPRLTCITDMVDLRQAVWHHWDLTAGWTVVTALKMRTLEDSVSLGERGVLKETERSKVMARIEPIDKSVLTTRFAISREPLWFKAAFPAYVRLSWLEDVLRRR